MNRNGAVRWLVVLWLVTGSMCVAGAAWGEYRTVEGSSPQEVVEGVATKAVRGLTNVTTGWLEFPKQIYLTLKEDGVAKGVAVGPFKGLGMTVVRTAAGVGETLTFLFPFPGFYGPWLEPAFVWQKE